MVRCRGVIAFDHTQGHTTVGTTPLDEGPLWLAKLIREMVAVGIPQSAQWLVTGLTIRCSSPGAGCIPIPVQTGAWSHPTFFTVGTGAFCRGWKRSGRGVDSPPLTSRLRMTLTVPVLPAVSSRYITVWPYVNDYYISDYGIMGCDAV